MAAESQFEELVTPASIKYILFQKQYERKMLKIQTEGDSDIIYHVKKYFRAEY